MTTRLRSAVAELDLRNWSGGQTPALVGRIVVLDDAATLVEHSDHYLTLAGDRQVKGIICLAVGESVAATGGDAGGEEVVLRRPAVLGSEKGVVLWLGDEHGVLWGPSEDLAQPVETDPPTSLERLRLILRVPEVFDAVQRLITELPNRAASPGLRVFSGAPDGAKLAVAEAEVVRALTESWPDVPAPDELHAAISRIEAAHQAPVGAAWRPHSATDLARVQAAQQLGRARTLAGSVGSWRLLRGTDRPGPALGYQVRLAGRSAQEYRSRLGELVFAIDGQLRLGDRSVQQVVELGVQEPVGVQRPAVAAGLSTAVRQGLTRDPSLPRLAAQLREVASGAQPQGCPGVAQRISGVGPLQRGVPELRRWPLPLLSTVPAIVLSCFLLAFLPSVDVLRWALGGALMLGWSGAGWLLLARWPGPTGELGLGGAAPRAVGTYGLFGLLGATGGTVADRYLGGFLPLPSVAVQSFIALVILLCIATVWLTWQNSARRLDRALQLPELHEALEQMTMLAGDAVTREWYPSQRRRVVAEALNEAAEGLDEIGQALVAAGRLVTPDRPPEPDSSALPGITPPVPPELITVLRTDLLELAEVSLQPAWQATTLGRRADAGVYAQRAERLLREYAKHVLDFGVMTLPHRDGEPQPDPEPRQRLLIRTWSESPEVRDVLRSRSGDDMVQLCAARQLADLSGYGEPALIRFAPESIRPILEADWPHHNGGIQGQPIQWTAGAELAGVLRLLTLQPGAVHDDHGGGTS